MLEEKIDISKNIIVQTNVGELCMLFMDINHIVGIVYLKIQGHFTHETESPLPVIGGKGRVGLSSLHPLLEGPMECVNAR